jgi:hypothetical protein
MKETEREKRRECNWKKFRTNLKGKEFIFYSEKVGRPSM